MFKRTIAAIMILVATLCLAVKVDAADKPTQWLIYWYICGSDLESDNHFSTLNIAEMQKVKFPANVKVLIAAGGSTQWHHPTLQAGGEGIYLYSNNLLKKEADWDSETGKANMGDLNTLETFLRYGEENFDAERRIIIFQNHGGLSGICYDKTFKPDEQYSLSYDDLKSAFSAVYGSAPEKIPFELIGFNACMTGSYELANSIADFSHYMMGSEPSSNPIGYDIKSLFSALANDTSINGDQLAKVLCDNSMKRLEFFDKADGFNLKAVNAFSVIDLTKMPELRQAYEEYFTEAVKRSDEETGFSGAFARAAESRKADRYSNLYTDLGLLAKNTESIMPVASKKLLKAIDKAVVYNKRGDYLKSKGISTYYPYISTEKIFSENATEQAAKYRDAYFELISNQKSSYAAQVELYSKLLDLDVLALEDEDTVFVERKKDSHLFAQLKPEQLESVSSIQCMLFPLDESNKLELGGAILTSADDLKIDWKKGIATEKFRAVQPMFDGQKIIMYPSVSGRGHTFYNVPILYRVSVTDDKGAMQEIDVQRELIVRYDTSTKKYEIIGFGENIENGMVRANRGKPQPGHVITPLYITLSDDATNEQLGLTMNVDPKTGNPIILQSVIESINVPNTNEKVFLKWKAGEPFVYTRDSVITNEPIRKGTYWYFFAFNAPSGESAYSYPGVIAVNKGKIFRFTTEEFAKLIAESANK